jgi:DNA polymerase-3 subunit epsilon
MAYLLRELEVLVIDCQASGATPAYGELLELGWAVCGAHELVSPVHSYWIAARHKRRVPRAIRELTGWSESNEAEAIPEQDAFRLLRADMVGLVWPEAAAPTVIHYARFELPFLRDLHERLGGGEPFPFDAVDLHTVAARLFPDLPRRNIRALAGFLGHSPELLRRCAGHVEASAFIWRALVPRLATLGVSSWGELSAWLAEPVRVPRRNKRVFPLAPEVRKALPDRPGVYRFVRRGGDIIYVGKAASLKKRVASHFSSGARATERGLEMLTQVHDIRFSETASILEAALLETDEIKALDPPYNVQLRSGERSAWFAAHDLSESVALPDPEHRVGPLPSSRALSPRAALIALLEGAPATPKLLAFALAVPSVALPDDALFREGFEGLVADHLSGLEGSARVRIDRASRALWLERGRKEVESTSDEEATPALWDLARVRRRLERNLVQTGLLLRRARWLCLLASADIAYREADMASARLLALRDCQIVERSDLDAVLSISSLAVRRPPRLPERQAAFDAASYDRLRVLSTELRRVFYEGGEVAVRIGAHTFSGERLARLTRTI